MWMIRRIVKWFNRILLEWNFEFEVGIGKYGRKNCILVLWMGLGYLGGFGGMLDVYF